ncbi:MAG: Ig-like domain-containing protein, partial [Syntrophomonadaceae bacterium]|nr:Ig-like domain-containing protein [Syntrophomonadaceae bacterium]
KRVSERGILMQKGRLNLLVLLTLSFCLLLAIPVIAGQGDGSGGGQGNPLELVSSNPADGDTGVALDTEIRLSFSKNVVNMTVKDINKNCFSLYGDNQPIEVEVVMADDQIEPEYKNDIVLVAGEGLRSDTSYIIKVAPELQSKSGAALDKELVINFSTAASSGSAGTDTSKDITDNMEQPETEGDKGISTTVLIIIAVIAAGVLIYAYTRRKK